MNGQPPPHIGRRLREEREARRLTLAQLAEACDLTKGYLSKVEREQATPSVASLLRLCGVLGLSIGELFEEHNGDLVRASQYPPINFGGQNMREALLTPTLERRLQVIHSCISPGGGSGAELYSLPVDVEMVFVLDGELEISLDGEVHRLYAGDALTFAPSVPHAFTNPQPSDDTCVLWILTPGLSADDSRDHHPID